MDDAPSGTDPSPAEDGVLEIERTFLLDGRPDVDHPDAQAGANGVLRIDQWYLHPHVESRGRRRLRRQIDDVGPTWIYTEKTRHAPGLATEREWELPAAVALDLRDHEADGRRKPIAKTRYRFTVPASALSLPGDSLVSIDIDRLHSPAKVWLAEIELADVSLFDADLVVPSWWGPCTEVTGVQGWSNASIARRGLPA